MKGTLPEGSWNRSRRAVNGTALSAAFLMCVFASYAQDVDVTGHVRDARGPLPGVSVLEKGTSHGTTTDAEGRYTMSVSSEDAVLVFSFIGYKTQEVPVASRTRIDISMEEEVTALNEVVVTALGVKKEVKSLGYAVQTVEGEAVTKAREPNVINSLTGRVAGLEIRNQTGLFQDPGIRLRGSTPLIVIDGVPSVDADIWKLNADDIETYSGAEGSDGFGALWIDRSKRSDHDNDQTRKRWPGTGRS